ncbi:MAG: prepilin-type N-terminal cleavage/methylation domain-containing protein [Maricaulaceae bacterium]
MGQTRRHIRSGFTLLETIAALAVVALAAFVATDGVARMLGSSARLFPRLAETLERKADLFVARATLERISPGAANEVVFQGDASGFTAYFVNPPGINGARIGRLAARTASDGGALVLGVAEGEITLARWSGPGAPDFQYLHADGAWRSSFDASGSFERVDPLPRAVAFSAGEGRDALSLVAALPTTVQVRRIEDLVEDRILGGRP